MTGLGLLALLLVAEPESLTLAMPSLGAEGLAEGEAAYWTAVLANGLRQQGLAVVAAPSAPQGSLRGELKRIAASGVRVDLRALDADGKVLAAFSMTAQKQGEVPVVLQRAAQELAGELFRRTGAMPVPQKQEALPAPPEPPTAASKLKPGIALGIAVAVLGAGAAAGGVALLVQSRNGLTAVAQGRPASYFAAQQQANEAKNLSTVSTVLLATGGVLFVGGLLYALYSGRVDTFFSVTAMLAPGMGGLTLSGALP